jgi:Ca-activated chloride channel family protein
VKVSTATASGAKRKPGEPAAPAAVLVISDGAAQGGRVTPDEAIRRAPAAHLPIFTALLGTDDGIVEVPRIGGYVERIRVPPDPDLLRRVSQQTNGRFFAAPRAEDLKAVYADLRSRLGSVKKDEEISFAFGAVGAALFVLAGALSAVWLRRTP